MKVFVTGASGFVGLGVVGELVKRGHQVVGLVRSPSRVDLVKKLGAEAVVGDLNEESAYSPAASANALVHCAQPEFYTKRISAGLVKATGEQDHRWVRKLLQAGAGHAKVFVYTSGAWVYGHTGDQWVDEKATLNCFAAGAFKVEGETLAHSEAKRLGYTSSVVMRPGSVYGEGGTFETFTLGPMRKKKTARWIGSGKQYVSLIHREDLGRAYALAIEKSPGFETYNLADDEPVAAEVYMGYLAARMGAPAPGGVPTFVVRVVGGLIAEALSSSQRVKNQKAKAALGWSLSLPTYREGMNLTAERARAASGTP